MNDLLKTATELQLAVASTMEQLDIDSKIAALKDLQTASQAADFWADNRQAQATMKQIAKLDAEIKPWPQLKQQLAELAELIALNDQSLRADIEQQLNLYQTTAAKLRQQLKFNGQYDDHDAIISIFAGAGGTDAQDWTQMLLRMYSRWAEKSHSTAKVLDVMSGEEAGIKSVTLEIDGLNAYGQLKGEHGVHRLVRLSPFNADNLRQTSFAKVEVLPKIDTPDEIIIDDKDLKIDVFRSGGHGGQSVNTTDSAVRLTHLPTGIVVSIQNERSQMQNRESALTILRSKLAVLQIEQHADNLRNLKGPNEQAAWGNQIRSYVLHPYKQVKDLRTGYQSNDPDAILDGELEALISAYLEQNLNPA